MRRWIEALETERRDAADADDYYFRAQAAYDNAKPVDIGDDNGWDAEDDDGAMKTRRGDDTHPNTNF